MKKVLLTFDNGTSQEFVLKDNILDYQIIKLSQPVKRSSVKITIKRKCIREASIMTLVFQRLNFYKSGSRCLREQVPDYENLRRI